MPGYTKEQVKGLYDQMNTDGVEGLTALEIRKMMTLLKQADDAESVQAYFDKHNKDKDGVLSFDEFYKAFTLKDNKDIDVSDLDRLFKEFDADNSGYLELKEVKELMVAAGLDVSKAEKDFEKVDTSNDGKVSFQEFQTLIKGIVE